MVSRWLLRRLFNSPTGRRSRRVDSSIASHCPWGFPQPTNRRKRRANANVTINLLSKSRSIVTTDYALLLSFRSSRRYQSINRSIDRSIFLPRMAEATSPVSAPFALPWRNGGVAVLLIVEAKGWAVTHTVAADSTRGPANGLWIRCERNEM